MKKAVKRRHYCLVAGWFSTAGGPIPPELVNHRNFEHFSTGLARDGPPLPEVKDEWHAIKILIVPVVLVGYFDLSSDLYTSLGVCPTTYCTNQSGHPIWFGLGLLIALGPAIILSVFYLLGSWWFRQTCLGSDPVELAS